MNITRCWLVLTNSYISKYGGIFINNRHTPNNTYSIFFIQYLLIFILKHRWHWRKKPSIRTVSVDIYLAVLVLNFFRANSIRTVSVDIYLKLLKHLVIKIMSIRTVSVDIYRNLWWNRQNHSAVFVQHLLIFILEHICTLG